MHRHLILPALLFFSITSLSHARTIHVPDDSPTIQGGIDAAVDGDTVMISPGTYEEHNIDFRGKASGDTSVYVECGSTLRWGSGMIDADPLFLSLRGYDDLLRPGSPCIDSGDPALEDGFDWPDGYPNGLRSDIGAYGGPGNSDWMGD